MIGRQASLFCPRLGEGTVDKGHEQFKKSAQVGMVAHRVMSLL